MGLISIKDAVAQYGVDEQELRGWVKQKKVGAKPRGRGYAIDEDSLLETMQGSILTDPQKRIDNFIQEFHANAADTLLSEFSAEIAQATKEGNKEYARLLMVSYLDLTGLSTDGRDEEE